MEWYALTVVPNHEQTAHKVLCNKEVECFLPTYRVKRRWADRWKILDLPLFPGYVFSRFDYPVLRTEVLRTPGVRTVVGCGRPEPITDEEIAHIKKTVASGLPVLPWSYVQVGQRVRVTWGSMQGVEGVVVEEKKNNVSRVVVSIHMLQRSIAVEMDRDLLAPVKDVAKVVVAPGRQSGSYWAPARHVQ